MKPGARSRTGKAARRRAGTSLMLRGALALTVAVSGTFGTAALVLRHQARDQREDRLGREEANARTAVARRLLAANREHLRAAAAFAASPALRDALNRRDAAAARRALEGLGEVHGWSLLVVTDFLGRVLGTAGEVPPDHEVLTSPTIAAAAAGEAAATHWRVGGRLFQVRVEPVRAPDGRVAGAIALGQRLDAPFLAALRAGIATDALLEVGGVAEPGAPPIAAGETLSEPLGLGQLESGEPVGLRLVLAAPVARELPWTVLAGASGLWLLGSLALGWLVLRPHREALRSLARGADLIARGDLDSPIEVQRTREARELEAALEAMRSCLRRRVEELEGRCGELAGALDLERRVGEQAEHRLEAAMREQARRSDRGAAELAHELRTPAATVLATMTGVRHGMAEWLGCLAALDASTFGPEHSRLFYAALEEIARRAPLGRPHEPDREALAQELEANHVRDPDRAARTLIRTGLAARWQDLLPLLRRPDAAAFLAALEAFGRVHVHVHSGETAAEVIAAVGRGASSRFRRDRSSQVDLRRGLEDALVILDHEMRGRVEIRHDLPPLPLVRGDGTELCQVWTNLIHNSVQAMGPEGGRLSVEARAEEGWVVVGVTDSGPGVDDKVRESLFEPYVTTKAPAQASGLGLSVVRRIVEAHGGRIYVDSVPGRTRFEVRLPAAAAVVAAEPAGPETVAAGGGRR